MNKMERQDEGKFLQNTIFLHQNANFVMWFSDSGYLYDI